MKKRLGIPLVWELEDVGSARNQFGDFRQFTSSLWTPLSSVRKGGFGIGDDTDAFSFNILIITGKVELHHLNQKEQPRSKAYEWELGMKEHQEMTEGITFQNEGSNMGSGRK